ncbi:MAG: trans-sulfuration enzyme family protein [Streptosporangiaceae bacterium]
MSEPAKHYAHAAGLSTRCVHAGDTRDAHGAIHLPLYNHAIFAFESTQQLLDVVEGRRDGNLYTRYGLNPTIRAVERKLADLEGGEAALAFGSGMAAEAATILAHTKAGEHVVCLGDVYSGTIALLGENLTRVGIESTFLINSEAGRLAEVVGERTRIVFFETPTNPTLEVFDIAGIAEVARRAGALVVADNTFATPVNQRPLDHGADIVIHSATKYLGGHDDITGGAAIGRADLLAPVALWRKNLGQVIAPEVAYLLSRSMRTLVVRVRAQNASAAAIAGFLAGHPRIASVHYPGRATGSQAEIVARQMHDGGGIVSFVLDADAAQTAKVVDRLRLISLAPSLGGVESLACQPATVTHHALTPEDRARRGILDGMVRLSVGLEDTADLIEDLDNALAI